MFCFFLFLFFSKLIVFCLVYCVCFLLLYFIFIFYYFCLFLLAIFILSLLFSFFFFCVFFIFNHLFVPSYFIYLFFYNRSHFVPNLHLSLRRFSHFFRISVVFSFFLSFCWVSLGCMSYLFLQTRCVSGERWLQTETCSLRHQYDFDCRQATFPLLAGS